MQFLLDKAVVCIFVIQWEKMDWTLVTVYLQLITVLLFVLPSHHNFLYKISSVKLLYWITSYSKKYKKKKINITAYAYK